MKKFTSYNLVLKSLEVLPKDRYKEVIIHRFGLEDGKRKTLEAIGKKYGITRERVRQIEEAAFFILRKPPILTSLRPAFDTVDWYLNQRGKLAREERILNELTDTEGLSTFIWIIVPLSTLNKGAEYRAGSLIVLSPATSSDKK